MSVYAQKYYYSITVYYRYPGGTVLFHKVWEDMPWAVRTKWNWYFRYRAALAQVQNPKSTVEVREWSLKIKDIEDLIEIQKKSVSSAKGQVTKIENLLEKAEKHWNKIFPISEDILYKKAKEKLAKKQHDLSVELLELRQLEIQKHNGKIR